MEKLSPEVPIYIITEGNEPPFFTRFFKWDSAKTAVSTVVLYFHGSIGLIECLNENSTLFITAGFWTVTWQLIPKETNITEAWRDPGCSCKYPSVNYHSWMNLIQLSLSFNCLCYLRKRLCYFVANASAFFVIMACIIMSLKPCLLSPWGGRRRFSVETSSKVPCDLRGTTFILVRA